MDIVTYALLNGKIKNYASNVDEWLEENVDPTTGYVLDRSLQMANAAAPADMVGDINDEVGDLKNTFNTSVLIEQRFNATDVLLYGDRKNTTRNGAIFTWNLDGSCTVTSNSATTNSAYCDMFLSPDTLPFWLEKGKQYNVTFSGTLVNFRVFIYENGVLNNTPICSTYENATFTIPSSATGLIIRLNVGKNRTPNETVDPHIYVGMANSDIVAELRKKFSMIKYNYSGIDANDIPDSTIQICDGTTTANLPDATSTFIVETAYTSENKNNGYQIAYLFTAGKRYWRRKASGTWYNWITYDVSDSNDYFSTFGIVTYYGTLSAGDLNDIDKTSMYMLSEGITYEHAPIDEGFIISYKISSLITAQFAIEFTSGKIYYRRKSAAGWSVWRPNDLSVPLSYVAFGDSLTWGAVWDMDQTTYLYRAARKYRIPTRIAHAIGMDNNFVNEAVGGFGYYAGSQSMTDKIKEYDFTGVEIVTIMAGVNDKADASHPLGSADNPATGTICGAIKDIIDWFNSNYPKVQLIFIQPTPSGHLADNWGGQLAAGWSLNSFDEEVSKLCHDNHVGYVNWWECTYCKNWNDFSGGYSYDGTTLIGPNYSHPTNELDYARIGDYIAGKVAALFHSGNN